MKEATQVSTLEAFIDDCCATVLKQMPTILLYLGVLAILGTMAAFVLAIALAGPWLSPLLMIVGIGLLFAGLLLLGASHTTGEQLSKNTFVETDPDTIFEI